MRNIALMLALYMPCHDHVNSGTGRVHDWFYPLFADADGMEGGAESYILDWLFPLI